MTRQIIYQNAPKYYHNYLDLVPSSDLMKELRKSKDTTLELIKKIRPDEEDFAYQTKKWTLKQVIKHIIDCERIFAYRAFRFSRFDSTELYGFDENKYIAAIQEKPLFLSELSKEYQSVRNATIDLYKNMDDDMLSFVGKASQDNFTARAIGYITVGHNLHHCRIITERYLNHEQ